MSMNVCSSQAWGSALRAGVLSFASPKESSQRKGDPEGGAGYAGPLRYSESRAAAELGLRPQTVLADCPRHSCVAQRLPRGPQRRPGSTVFSQKADSHGEPEKTAENEILWRRSPAQPPSLPRRREARMLDSRLRGNDGTNASPRIVSPGPLRGAEQRRGWRKRGEDCLRAQPEFRSPRQSRVAQGTGAAGTDPGVAFSLATFFWPHKRKYARQQGGTPSQLISQNTTQNQ